MARSAPSCALSLPIQTVETVNESAQERATLAEDYVSALTNAAAPAFFALLRPGEHAKGAGFQRIRRHAIQLLNQVRGDLTLHEQVVVPPLFVEAAELARRTAKPPPPRVIAFVAELNANPSAVTDEDLNRLQIRGTDTCSRVRLPELVLLVEPAIVAEAQAAFPGAPTSLAVVLRWHLRGLNLDLALRKAALSAEFEARRPPETSSCRRNSGQVAIKHL